MDPGSADQWAIMCESSADRGYACAEALGGEAVDVVINGRDDARLAAARRNCGLIRRLARPKAGRAAAARPCPRACPMGRS